MEAIKKQNNNQYISKPICNKINTASIFESFLDSTSDSLIITDITTSILDLSKSALKLFGILSKSNLLGRKISTLFSDVEKELLEKFLSETIQIGYNKTLELVYIKPNGDKINGIMTATVVFDENKNANYIMFIFKDADKNEPEKLYLERQQQIRQFQKLWSNSKLIVQLVDENGNIVRVNDKWLKIFGYKSQDVVGKSLINFVDCEENVLNRCFKVLKSEKEIYGCEFKFIKQDGTFINILFDCKIIYESEDGSSLTTCTLTDITNQKEKELEIKKNENNFKFLFDTITDAVFIWEQNINGSPSKCLDVNTIALNTLGYNFEEIKHHAPTDLITEEVDSADESEIYNTYLCKKDGSKIPVAINSIYTSYFGKPVYITVCKDITEKKKIQHLSKLFNHSIENAGEAILWIEQNAKIKYANKEISNILGFTQKEILQLHVFDIDYEHTYEKFLEKWEQTKSGLPFLFESKLITKSQQLIPVEIKISYLNFGRDEYLFASIRDITKRKLAEENLRTSEAHKSLVLNSLPICFYVSSADDETPITWASEQLYTLSGFKINKFIEEEKFWANRIHPKDREYVLSKFKNLKKGAKYKVEYRWKVADGNYRWFQDSGIVIENTDNKSNIIGSWMDISDRKVSEEQLKTSEEKYRTIFNLTPEVILLMDKRGKIIDVNRRTSELIEYDVDEILEKNILSLMPINFISKTKVMKNFALRMMGKNVEPYEVTFISKNGEQLTGIVRAKTIRDSEGKITHNIAVISDITGIKSHEKELIIAKEKAERSSQLKSEFLAQMSHEIRTPINALISFASLLEEQLAEYLDEDLESSFRIMNGAGKRIIRTVDLMLNMADLQSGSYEYRPKEIDLYSKVLTPLYNIMQAEANEKGIGIEIIKDTDEASIFVDEYSVYQTFKILLENAIKYTDEGKVCIQIGKNTDNNIFVNVIDSGIGISKEYLSELFSPFSQEEQGYTRSYEGNGLGLALVKKYGELNNAKINVISEKRKGSEFKVTFSK